MIKAITPSDVGRQAQSRYHIKRTCFLLFLDNGIYFLNAIHLWWIMINIRIRLNKKIVRGKMLDD